MSNLESTKRNIIMLSWSLFRIRQDKSAEAPLSGEITKTSYPVCNKTSLSRKPCIPDKKLIWNTISKSWSLFQNPSRKITWSAPLRRNHDDVISGWQWNLVISETMHPRWKVTEESYQEVMVALSESIMKNRVKRPLALKSRWRLIRLAIEARYLGNHASQIKSYYWSQSGSNGRSFRIHHKKIAWSTPWRRNHDDVISGWQ